MAPRAEPKRPTLDAQAEELLQLVSRRDAQSGERFEALWEQLRPLNLRIMRRYSRRLANVGLTVDDALSELALHLLARLERWQPAHGSFEAWWQRVAERRLLDLAAGPPAAEPLEHAPEARDGAPATAERAIAAVSDESLGNLWQRYRACWEHLLQNAEDPMLIRRRLLAFQWVELEGLENRVVAATLGIPEYQCFRDRAWVRRELPRVFRELFPELADGEVP